MDSTTSSKANSASLGHEPLLILPNGTTASHDTGYIPLLVDFTLEDKAAKGLRKRSGNEKPEPPVYFSALEVVRDNRVLLLEGPSGCGKTTFARDLCFQFAKADEEYEELRNVIRNEEGYVSQERWDGAKPRTVYFDLSAEEVPGLESFVSNTLPGIVEELKRKRNLEKNGRETLIIIDGIETAGDEGPRLLKELVARVEGLEHLRLLVLADSTISRTWSLPAGVVRHRILPLLRAQRRVAVSRFLGAVASEEIGIGAAAVNPAVFALALQAGVSGDVAEDAIDSWLDVVVRDKDVVEQVAKHAFERVVNGEKMGSPALEEDEGKQPLLSVRKVQQLFAARDLAKLPTKITVRFFQRNPLLAEPVVSSVLARLAGDGKAHELARKLLRSEGHIGQRGALLVSPLKERSHVLQEEIRAQMLTIINESTISVSERNQAGRVLSRLGDPRDLSALANVPGGTFIMGSNSHPNSQPQAPVTVDNFRIGVYPVVNRDYALFIHETNRKWLSPDGFDPERQNAPATDLSWHDARAFCAWLTERWRSDGTISKSSDVRLPREPEWERACNGDQNILSAQGPVYPWGSEWSDNAANSDETGLNGTCAVGLFPAGRSPYGCHDMAGQVWEWCTTLWGEDMTAPSFSYPYRGDDEREDLDGPGNIRRVLRGGCFSSGALKACGTYRGSLEPGGSWRGNGFRIVVAECAA